MVVAAQLRDIPEFDRRDLQLQILTLINNFRKANSGNVYRTIGDNISGTAGVAYSSGMGDDETWG